MRELVQHGERLGRLNWEAISSRVVTARLKAMGRGQRRPGGARTMRNSFISVISAYAPTARAPPGIKSKFMEELQDVLDKVPSSDLLLLLGDFNARVGCSDTNGRGIRGRYGIGAGNKAGDRLLEFCAVNQLTVMNTWFAKKDIHLATWQHPATRQQYMIDYVLMCAGQRTVCTDVQVMRGASCWTDHHMVRAKLRVGLPRWRKIRVSALPVAVHTLHAEKQRDAYERKLDEVLHDNPHNTNGAAEYNWGTLKECVMSAAEAVLGRGRKRQPDWFLEAENSLRPLLEAKRAAHDRLLHADNTSNRREFRKHQRMVARAVVEAKERWIKRVASTAELARRDGKQRWKSVRQLQLAFAGRKATRPTALFKEDGVETQSPDEVKHGHFN